MQTRWLALAYHINLSVIFDTLTLSVWMTVTSWHFTSSVTHFIYSVFRLYWYWPMWLDKCQWAKSCFTFVAELKSTTQAQRPLFATITPLRVKNKFRWLNCCINYLYTVFSIFCILLIMQGKNLTDAVYHFSVESRCLHGQNWLICSICIYYCYNYAIYK